MIITIVFILFSIAIILYVMLKKKNHDKEIVGSFKVSLSNVTYNPTYSKKVLDNISLTIEPSEIVAIIGPNSAGKSSLLKAISGEIFINSGEVYVGSTKINKPINRLIDGVGIVHQFDDSDLIGVLSLAQNIAIRQILANSHKTKLFAIPNYWLTDINAKIGKLNILDKTDSFEVVRNLAGGERQMLNVATAIHLEHIKNPCGLLLLDEHTSRLSPLNGQKVMEFTMNEVVNNKITTIMVTHKYNDALTYANRILIIKNGKIEHDIRKKDDHAKWTLEKITEFIEVE